MKTLYNEDEALAKYRKMTAHDKLMEELKAINLAPAIMAKGEVSVEQPACTM